MTAQAVGADVVVDFASGVYGHRVSMLDFEPADLRRFREIGRLVGFDDRPPDVTTALALSGSAAQSKIQSYPGDADFFERVHYFWLKLEAVPEVKADMDSMSATALG